MTPVSEDPLGRTFFETLRPTGEREIEVAPGQEVCDFCLEPNPVWEYPVKGRVRITGHSVFTHSDDEWAACQACRDLIDSGDTRALVKRIVHVQRSRPKQPDFEDPGIFEATVRAAANVRAFMRVKQGTGRPFTS